MNAPPMETIFLVLSGVVLAAGVLYWFWSHIQLTQKKVQLLENAIFELRTLVAAPAADSSGHASLQGHQGPSSGSPSGPVYKDLEDDEAEDGWVLASTGPRQQVPSPSPAGPAVEAGSTSLESLNANSDLQPGGRIDLPPSDEERDIITTDEQFRELFVQRDASSPTVTTTTTSASASSSSSSSSESLESMPVKELRRLAEQRGITGSSELRKKELLAALRQQVAPQAAAAAATEPVEEETTRTLDLTNDVTVLE